MTHEQIKDKAAALGIRLGDISRWHTHEIIHMIQAVEGSTPCYMGPGHNDCIQRDCCFFDRCTTSHTGHIVEVTQ